MSENINFTSTFKADISDLKKGIQEANLQLKENKAEYEKNASAAELLGDENAKLSSKLEYLSKNLSAQNDKLEKYRKEQELVNKEIKNNEANIERLKKEIEESSKVYGKNSDKVKTLEKELKKTEKEYNNNVKTSKNLNIALDKQQAEVNKTEKEFKDLQKEMSGVDKQNKETAKSFDKLDKEMKDTDQNALNCKEGFTVLKGAMANLVSFAVINGLKTLNNLLKDGVKNAVQMGIEASCYADDIITMSNNTGIAIDKLQAYSAVAGLLDVDLETLTKSMARNIKKMGEVQKGSKTAIDVYNKLGVKIKDTNGHLRDSEAVFYDVVDALNKINNETERDAYSMEIFGKSAQDLNSIIKVGSKGIKEAMNEAEEMGAVLDEDLILKLGAVNDSYEKFNSSIKGSKNLIGAMMSDLLGGGLEDGYNIVAEINKMLKKALKGGELDSTILTQKVKKLFENLKKNTPKFISYIKTIIKAVVKGIGNFNINDIVKKISKKITDIIGKMAKLLTKLAPDILKGLVDGIIKNLPIIIQAVLDIIMIIINTLTENIGLIIDAIKDLIKIITDFLSNSENIKKVIDASIDLFMAIIEAIPDVILALVDALPDIITTIIDTLLSKETLIKLGEAGFKLFMMLITEMPKIQQEIALAGKEIFEELAEAYKEIDFKEVGKNIMKAIIEGMKAYFLSIKEDINNINDLFFSQVPENLKNKKNIKVLQSGKGAQNDKPSTVNNNRSIVYSPTFNYNRPLNSKEIYRQNKNLLNGLI